MGRDYASRSCEMECSLWVARLQSIWSGPIQKGVESECGSFISRSDY